MAEIDKVYELVRGLTKQTRAGLLVWNVPNPADPTWFLLPRRSGSVELRTRDSDGLPPYLVRIYNTEAVVVNTLESDPENEDDDVVRLYLAAQESALRIDKTVDDLLKEIGC